MRGDGPRSGSAWRGQGYLIRAGRLHTPDSGARMTGPHPHARHVHTHVTTNPAHLYCNPVPAPGCAIPLQTRHNPAFDSFTGKNFGRRAFARGLTGDMQNQVCLPHPDAIPAGQPMTGGQVRRGGPDVCVAIRARSCRCGCMPDRPAPDTATIILFIQYRP